MDIFLKEEIIELAKISYDINHGIDRDPALTAHLQTIDPRTGFNFGGKSRNIKEYNYRKKYVIDYINFFTFLISPECDNKNIEYTDFWNFLNSKGKIGKLDTDFFYYYNILNICHKLYESKLINYKLPDITIYFDEPNIIPNIPLQSSNNPGDIIQYGLTNPDNRCWMNTFTQLILSIPEIRECFLKSNISQISTDYYALSDVEIKSRNDNLLSLKKFIEYFDDDCADMLHKKKIYIEKVLRVKSTRQKLINFQSDLNEFVSAKSNYNININHHYADYQDIFYKAKKEPDGTGDASEAIIKFIELLNDPDDPNLLGLYEIFNINYIFLLMDNSKIILNKNEKMPFIRLKRYEYSKNYEKIDDLQILLDITYIQDYKFENKTGDFKNKNIIEYDANDLNERIFYVLLPNTRYLLIDLAYDATAYDETSDPFIPIKITTRINISGSIDFDGTTFNLLGAICHLPSKGGKDHYVYQLFCGDGTVNMVKEYNDDNGPSRAITKDTATTLIYVRA